MVGLVVPAAAAPMPQVEMVHMAVAAVVELHRVAEMAALMVAVAAAVLDHFHPKMEEMEETAALMVVAVAVDTAIMVEDLMELEAAVGHMAVMEGTGDITEQVLMDLLELIQAQKIWSLLGKASPV